MMLTRDAIVLEARSWLGTRFHHQAAVKGAGCDCIGLIAGVAAALDIPEARTWLLDARRLSYGKEPDPAMLLGAAAEYLREIPLSDMSVGDIALLRVRNGVKPQHFGIITGDSPRYMIHANILARKVVEHRLDAAWSALLLRAYRYRALA